MIRALILPIAMACVATTAQPGFARNDKETITTDSQASAGPFGSKAIPENTLRVIAGREDSMQFAQADLKAGVAHNSVGNNATTGAAQIDGNAFQNMSGLSILNVNTGNNVAINAAMNVNISITSGP